LTANEVPADGAAETPEPASAGKTETQEKQGEEEMEEGSGSASLELPIAPPPGGGEVFNTSGESPNADVGADVEGYAPTPVDALLDGVYGDHPHQNDGCHLDGGISHDKTWQRRWKRVVQLPIAAYAVPKGRVGRRFVERGNLRASLHERGMRRDL
jgi:hypothetical protein